MKSMIYSNKLRFPENLFLIGVFLKQFYLLPSGSFQLGDLVLILSCGCILGIKQHGKIKLQKEDKLLLLFIGCIVIINLMYSLKDNFLGYNKASLYYIYNLIIILGVNSLIISNDEKSVQFLNGLNSVLKLSLVMQMLLYITGIGRWAYASRYSGTFNDPNQYAAFIFFSMIIIYALSRAMEKNCFLWIVLAIALILLSSSTGVMLGVFVFLVVLYFTSLKMLNRRMTIIWGVSLGLFILIYACLRLNIIAAPELLTNSTMYKRILSKVLKIINGNETSSLLTDRGWTRIVEHPVYLLFGAGEGNYERFGTWLEIHSSILGPLFYYGIVPFVFYIRWIYSKVKGVQSIVYCVYSSLIIEALFLSNTRQPLYWIAIALAGVKMMKKNEMKV